MSISLTIQGENYENQIFSSYRPLCKYERIFMNFKSAILFFFLLGPVCSAQWIKMSSPSANKMILSLAQIGQTLYTSTNGGDGSNTYFSTNGGVSWNISTLPIRGDYIAECGSIIYAGGLEGLYTSSDNGVSWKIFDYNYVGGAIYSIIVNYPNIYIGSSSGVTISNDNGLTWTLCNNGLPWSILSLALGNNVIYAGAYNGVYSSTDNGKSWNTINSGIEGKFVWSMAVKDPYLFAGTDQGVYRSSNNGQTWEFMNSGMPATYIFTLLVSGTTLFAGNDNGIFQSANNGSSWTVSLSSSSVRSLILSGSDIYAGFFYGSIYISKNNGAGWTTINSPRSSFKTNSLAFSGANIFAATDNGLFYSSDKGANWTMESSFLFSNDQIASVAVRDSTIIIGTSLNGVYFSTDYGLTWLIANSIQDEHIKTLTIDGPNSYAGTDSGIFFSTVNSSNWIRIYPVNALNMFPYVSSLIVDRPNIYAGSLIGAIISKDNGQTWNVVTSGLPDPVSVSSIVKCNSDLFAATATGIYILDNIKNLWIPINGTAQNFSNITSLVSYGSTLFAGSNSGDLLLTSNNGNNWSILNSRMTITQLYSLVINDSFIYAVTDNGILYSSISGMETNVESLKKTVPASYILFQNYPNPFNPATTISYQVPKPGKILIKVYDMLGREIRTLVNEEKPAGSYSLKFDGRGLTSGIYIYRMIASDNVFTRKFVLLK